VIRRGTRSLSGFLLEIDPHGLFAHDTVFAGQNVGVTQVGERIWLVTFMQYGFGLISIMRRVGES